MKYDWYFRAPREKPTVLKRHLFFPFYFGEADTETQQENSENILH